MEAAVSRGGPSQTASEWHYCTRLLLILKYIFDNIVYNKNNNNNNEQMIEIILFLNVFLM